MPGGVLEAPPDLTLTGPLGQRLELRAGQDYEPMGLSHPGEVKNTRLAFVGHGVTVSSKEISYDDYAGIDAAGKVVLVLRETPRAGNAAAPFPGGRRPASLVEKLQNAERHHAAAVVFVNDRDMATRAGGVATAGASAAAGASSTSTQGASATAGPASGAEGVSAAFSSLAGGFSGGGSASSRRTSLDRSAR